MATSKAKEIRAAGAVLWRPGPSGASGDEREYAVVHRPLRQDWSLPKGKLERGESWVAAAVREVGEETGHQIALGCPLPTLRYLVDGEPKQVRYWTARTDRSADDVAGFEPGEEIDDLAWLPYDQARERLSYAHDAGLVEQVAQGPPETTPLVLLRHGKAVKRAAWAGTVDHARPLEARGIAQARRLVPMLGAFGITTLISSDATRCRDTVLPYARAREIEVVDEPRLSEEEHEEEPRATRRYAERLLEDPAPTAVCSHRPVLPDLLGELLRRWKGRRPSPLGPGAFLVLHRDLSGSEPVVVAVERHRP
jgi:phosphohistidine phosphatase SixA/8-oxo-dGTP pyrophosphatase MutT (NUDIX family)